MSSSERYYILSNQRKHLKGIKTYLIRNGCSIATVEALNHEIEKVQKEINNIMWW